MVTPQEEGVNVVWQKEMVDKAEPKVKKRQLEPRLAANLERRRWVARTLGLQLRNAKLRPFLCSVSSSRFSRSGRIVLMPR